MPRSRNSRSKSPQKAPSISVSQGTPAYLLNQEGQILEYVQEMFHGQLDQQVIQLVLTECNWNVDEAIDRLLAISESSKSAPKRKQSQLAEIAEGVFGKRSNTEHSEKPSVTTSSLHPDKRAIERPKVSSTTNTISSSSSSPSLSASEFSSFGTSGWPPARTVSNEARQSEYTFSRFTSSTLDPGLSTENKYDLPYNLPVSRPRVKDTSVKQEAVSGSRRENEAVRLTEFKTDFQGRQHRTPTFTMKNDNSDFKFLVTGLGRSNQAPPAQYVAPDRAAAGRKFPVRLLSKDGDEGQETDSIMRFDSADLDDTVLQCICQVSPDVMDENMEMAMLNRNRGLSVSSATETGSSASSQTASPEPGRFQTSTPSNQPMTLPVLGTGLSVEAAEFVPRKKGKSPAESDGNLTSVSESEEEMPTAEKELQHEAKNKKGVNTSTEQTSVSPASVHVPMPVSSIGLGLSRVGSPMFITPKWRATGLMHRFPQPLGLPTSVVHVPPTCFLAPAIGQPAYSLARGPAQGLLPARVVYTDRTVYRRIGATHLAGPVSPATIDDMAVIATGQPIMATSEASRMISPTSVTKQQNSLAKGLMFQTAIEQKAKRVLDLIQRGVKVLVIVRGLPGSGKSTLARAIRFKGIILSTDDFFMKKDTYEHQPDKLPQAHQWNRDRAREALKAGKNPVIIDNTNTQRWEFKPYVSLGMNAGYHIEIFEPDTPWRYNAKELARRTVHGVPKEHIKRMLDRYEKDVTLDMVTGHSQKTPGNRSTSSSAATAELNSQVKSSGQKGSIKQDKKSGDESEGSIKGDKSDNSLIRGAMLDQWQNWKMNLEEDTGREKQTSSSPAVKDSSDESRHGNDEPQSGVHLQCFVPQSKPSPVFKSGMSESQYVGIPLNFSKFKFEETFYPGGVRETGANTSKTTAEVPALDHLGEMNSSQDEASFFSCSSSQDSRSVTPNKPSGDLSMSELQSDAGDPSVGLPEEVVQTVDDLIREHVSMETTLSREAALRTEEELKAILQFLGLPDEQRIAAENLISHKLSRLRMGTPVFDSKIEKMELTSDRNSDLSESVDESSSNNNSSETEDIARVPLQQDNPMTDFIDENIVDLETSSKQQSNDSATDDKLDENMDDYFMSDSSNENEEPPSSSAETVKESINLTAPTEVDKESVSLTAPTEVDKESVSLTAPTEVDKESVSLTAPTEVELRYWGCIPDDSVVEGGTGTPKEEVSPTWNSDTDEDEEREGWEPDHGKTREIMPQRRRRRDRRSSKSSDKGTLEKSLVQSNSDPCVNADDSLEPLVVDSASVAFVECAEQSPEGIVSDEKPKEVGSVCDTVEPHTESFKRVSITKDSSPSHMEETVSSERFKSRESEESNGSVEKSENSPKDKVTFELVEAVGNGDNDDDRSIPEVEDMDQETSLHSKPSDSFNHIVSSTNKDSFSEVTTIEQLSSSDNIYQSSASTSRETSSIKSQSSSPDVSIVDLNNDGVNTSIPNRQQQLVGPNINCNSGFNTNSDQGSSSVDGSPKVNSKKKKISKSRQAAKERRKPFFTKSEKEQFLTRDFNSFPLVSEAASHVNPRVGQDVKSDVDSPGLDKETTTDEAEDWKVVARVTREELSGVVSGLRIITGTCRHIYNELEDRNENSDSGAIKKIRMQDQSTSIDEELLSSVQEKGIDILKRCFPDVADDELECVLHTTQQDVEWAINLLVDWKYNTQLKQEEKQNFVQSLAKVRNHPGTSEALNVNQSPLKAHSSKCLQDLCFDLIETQNIALREELEPQLIQSGRERLDILERDNRRKISLLRSISLNEPSVSRNLFADSPDADGNPNSSSFLRSFSVPTPVKSHSRDREIITELTPNSHGISSLPLSTHEESARVETDNRFDSIIDKYLDGQADSSVPDGASYVTFNGQGGSHLVDYDSSGAEDEEGDNKKELENASVGATGVDISPGLLDSQVSPVISLPVSGQVLETLEQMFGPVTEEEDEAGMSCARLPIDRETAWMLHMCWKRAMKHRHKLREQQYLEDELLARKLQEEFDMHDLKAEESEQRINNIQGQRRVPHVKSLQEIMDEERANQIKEENRAKEVGTSERGNALATRMKRHELHKTFPAIDKVVLDDLFQANGYNLTHTVEAIRLSLESDTSRPQQEMSREASEVYDKRMIEAAKTQSLQEMLDSFMYTPIVKKDYQDAAIPEYEDYRGEANVHYRLRHECFQKAQEAHRRGLKQVASFYSDQGHLHTQKIKEANKRAAQQILSERNSDLERNSKLDLHGLHVSEAIDALNQIIPQKVKERKTNLIIITGRGSHSRGGVAKLRPSIIAYLVRHNYKFAEQQEGAFKVSLRN